MATARVQDSNFDKTVGKINDYMGKYRRSYMDEDYLRAPLDNPMKAAERRNADRAK